MLFGLNYLQWAILALTLILVLVMGAFGLVGLFQARSLVRREFNSYFLSPIAYVVIVVFLLITGALFFLTLERKLTVSGPEGTPYPMQFMLSQWWFWLVYLFIPPVLSMRLFAEERSTGTLEVLMTAPLRDWQVVLSKYVACFAFYFLMWVPTLAYLPILLDIRPPVELTANVWQPKWTVFSGLFVGGAIAAPVLLLLSALPIGRIGRWSALGLFVVAAIVAGVGAWLHYTRDVQDATHQRLTAGIDPLPVLTAYIGLLLAGAMFLALGLLISSLVRSQMIACVLSLVLNLFFMVAFLMPADMDRGSQVYQIVYFFSVPLHFDRAFAVGVLDTRHLVLYLSVAVCSLFLTVRSLESRRWQ